MQTQHQSTASQVSDAQLISEFRANPANRIIGELYRRYFNKVKNYCRKSLDNEVNAEDLAQDILLKAFENMRTLQNPQLWVAWLFRIARNEVLNAQKRQSHHRTEPIEKVFWLSEDPSDRLALEEKERKLNTLKILLEEPEARILKWKYVYGRSIEQLCQDLHVNESAVKMRLLRARARLVQRYETEYALS